MLNKNKSVKIIHFHFNIRNNRGDQAIVLSIKELLESKFNIIRYTPMKISQLSFFPKIFIEISQKIKSLLNNPKEEKDSSSNYNLINKLRGLSNWFLLRKINKHDLMIIGGGGFYSKWSLPLDDNLIKKIKIPIVLFGVGVIKNFGDSDFSKEQIKSIISLNKIAKISSVRDKKSKDFLNKLKIKNVMNIGDPAIFLRSQENNLVFKPKLKIGINIAAHNWKLQREYLPKVINAYIQVLNRLKKKTSFQLFYLIHHPNEKKVYEILKRFFPEIILIDNPPKKLKYSYSKLDLVISMMMHSSILAFSEKTSIINLAYDEKNYSFMQSIGQDDKIIDVRKINLNKFYSLIIRTLSQNNKNDFSRIIRGYKINTEKFLEKINNLF